MAIVGRKNKGVRNGRNRIFKLTDYRCWYCGVQLTKKKSNSRTIDHKVPVSRGGLTADENLVSCCQLCNVTKDNMTVDEYRSTVRIRHALKKLPKFWGEGRRSGPWIRALTKI